MTAVPNSVIATLGMERISDIKVISATGTPENAGLFLADLAFLDFKLKERPLVGLNRPYMLIGRDIINEWLLTLDGPRLQFEIQVRQR